MSNNIELKLSKSTVECYKYRHISGCYWADINVDAGNKAGRIQIASDFGDWQYYWGSCGSEFKQFLIELDKGYLASKFNADRWFDNYTTTEMWKKMVKESIASEKGFSAIEANKILRSIKELSDYSMKEEFTREAMEHKELMNYFNYCPDVCYVIEPGFKNFYEKIWPVFIETLKTEILATTT